MKCAVITPVGPGHDSDYASCRQSVETAWAANQGPFQALEILPMWDLEGRHGRSARRNDGIDQAVAMGCDWIFFLDADDLMASWAFERFARYADAHDAVWGLICENVYGTDSIAFREGQLPATDRLADILTAHPVHTLQMGHFVRSSAAAAVKFDVAMNCGEDFKYYLALWRSFRCAKVEDVFFINRRGHHSTGPRSADGAAWERAVLDLLRQAREGRL
ncbi:glycosyltransferase [Azospirillum sp.]|uniref:glycosyltransferase n=1 Tax=Azospirillum sp. TaxID=34012 RepID=UPI003D73A573